MDLETDGWRARLWRGVVDLDCPADVFISHGADSVPEAWTSRSLLAFAQPLTPSAHTSHQNTPTTRPTQRKIARRSLPMSRQGHPLHSSDLRLKPERKTMVTWIAQASARTSQPHVRCAVPTSPGRISSSLHRDSAQVIFETRAPGSHDRRTRPFRRPTGCPEDSAAVVHKAVM